MILRAKNFFFLAPPFVTYGVLRGNEPFIPGLNVLGVGNVS